MIKSSLHATQQREDGAASMAPLATSSDTSRNAIKGAENRAKISSDYLWQLCRCGPCLLSGSKSMLS